MFKLFVGKFGLDISDNVSLYCPVPFMGTIDLMSLRFTSTFPKSHARCMEALDSKAYDSKQSKRFAITSYSLSVLLGLFEYFSNTSIREAKELL